MFTTPSERRLARGFTLVELVSVITVLGILAAVAIPRMETETFQQAAFHTRVLAALRYAQKTAVSHRRPVCVTFPGLHSVSLNIDVAANDDCKTILLIPSANSNQIASGAATALFSEIPESFTFAANGTTSNRTIDFVGGARITIVGATGGVF
ncbi:GspH/FimT family pseudopilin [Propionivibrio dicarboxylicus]|uniref:Type II secretion system protein H n=1 Tax=Propionivibrio dicarboxylicus TaxID=83767 RepID=A0A1G8BXI8_9RHOO|nr:GspH/FimT family pseudopilin [Propionivibrio dicarboxylicus]SDH37882.1 MSHA pilin protein MshC [Propionivibrio dicarboxylicus]